MDRAIDKLRKLWADGKRMSALRLAASWPRLGAHGDRIRKAQAAFLSPGLYRGIGQNPEELIADGLAALRERYGLD